MVPSTRIPCLSEGAIQTITLTRLHGCEHQATMLRIRMVGDRSSRQGVRSMRCLHLLVFFALVPLAPSSAVGECLKSNVAGQSTKGQLAIGRARDAAGRPESPYILRLAS